MTSGLASILGEMKVPINKVLRDQLRLWRAHCEALERRFKNLQDTATDELIGALSNILNGELCPLFFEIDPEVYQTVPLGSTALIKWWPF